MAKHQNSLTLFNINALKVVDRLLDSPIICRLDEMVSTSRYAFHQMS